MDKTLNSLETLPDNTLTEGEKLKGEELKKAYTEKRGRVAQVIEKFEENDIFDTTSFNFTLIPHLDEKIFNDKKQHLMHHALSFSTPDQNSEWLWDERDVLAEDIVNFFNKIAVMTSDKEMTSSIMENIMTAAENDKWTVDTSEITDEKETTLLEEWNKLIKKAENSFPPTEESAKDRNEEVVKELENRK